MKAKSVYGVSLSYRTQPDRTNKTNKHDILIAEDLEHAIALVKLHYQELGVTDLEIFNVTHKGQITI
jgi:hypothetical protein